MKKRLIVVMSLIVGFLIVFWGARSSAERPTGVKSARSSMSARTALVSKKQTQAVSEPSGNSGRSATSRDSRKQAPASCYYKNLLIVNKKNPVPATFAPGEDPSAARAIKRLIADMQHSGMRVASQYSGYRSYHDQEKLYKDYVRTQGKEYADSYSARPGYSEHQTGLAFDLRAPSGLLLETPEEVEWLRDNACTYGFILRFPADKVRQTGYHYESWHLRYVGSPKLAREIKKSGLSLEEYVGAPGGNYQ